VLRTDFNSDGRGAQLATEIEADTAKRKALAAGDAASGGFLVPERVSADIIQLLTPRTLIRRLGPEVIPMPTGSIRVPRITQGTQANYIGENQNIPPSTMKFGQIMMTWKKLAAMVPISNDLIRYSAPAADAIVRNDVLRAMAQREDQGFMFDDGTGGTPRGLYNWTLPALRLTANPAAVTQATVTGDLGKLVLALVERSIPMTRPAWIFSPRTWNYFMTDIGTNSNQFIWREEIQRGTLWGWPIAFSPVVGNTYDHTGSGTANQSFIMLVDLADAVIGDSMNLQVDASSEAAYFDGSAVVAAFSLDQTVVRAIAEHDFAMRREESVAILEGVKYGAA
jgi:HK97 family phage major capsid protein